MTADPRTRAAARRYTRLVALLGSGHLLAFVDRAKVAAALPAIRHTMPMSDAAAAWVIGTAFALGYGAILLLLALLRRDGPGRWSWRLPVGVSLWGAGSVVTGLASTLGVMITARAAVGAGQALFIPAALAWVVAAGDEADQRAQGMARFTAAASAGRSAGLLLIGGAMALVAGTGASAWRWAFLLTALPNLLLLALVIAARPSAGPNRASATRPAPSSSRADWLHVAFLLLALVPIVVAQAVAGWLPTLLVRDRGLEPAAAAAWLGALTLMGGTGGQLLAGWLLARRPGWAPAAPLVVAAAMAAVLPCLLLLGWGPGLPAMVTGIVAANLSLALAGFAALFGWQRLVPSARRVGGNGLFLGLVTVAGVGFGPLVTGVLADRGPTLRLALLLTASGGALLAGLLVLVLAPAFARRTEP